MQYKMLTGGDSNLNSMQRYTDSLKGLLKQTMLNHETIFRKQVHELHRIYFIQRALMEDLSWENLDGYTSITESRLATPLPLQDPPKHKLLAADNPFPSLPMEGSTRIQQQDLLEVCEGAYSKLQHTPLGLQLQANDYIHHLGMEIPKKRSLTAFPSKPMEKKNFLLFNQVCDTEEVKLSLKIAEGANTKGGAAKSCYRKEISYLAHDVIDLVESSEGEEETIGDEHRMRIHGVPSPSSSISTRQDPSHGLLMKKSPLGNGQFCREMKSFDLNTGFHECHGSDPFINLLTKKRTTPSAHVDLNKVEIYESSCFSNDPGPSSSSPEESQQGNEASQQSIQTFERFTNLKANIEVEMVPMDLESIPEASPGLSEESGKHNLKPKEEKMDSFSKLVGTHLYKALGVTDFSRAAGNAESGQVNREKSEDSVSSSKESETTLKSDCYTDKNSNGTKDEQSGIEEKHKVGDLNLSGSEESGTTQVGSHIEETHSNLEDPVVKTDFEATKMDIFDQEAAESLIRISKGNSIYSQDLAENDMNEKPESSSESFESITLKLKESSLDDFSVTSNPIDVNERENLGYGLKLRRGRRLKDFQKDILPGMVSLSRHEICEDINIIEGVIRSKEYRKMRSGKIDDENWFSSVRRRPLKLNYAGRRRRYS